jgi:D-sedoheptulose 7-phosphate isomerase
MEPLQKEKAHRGSDCDEDGDQAKARHRFGGANAIIRAMSSFTREFLDESIEILRRLDAGEIDRVAAGLARSRDSGGRLFLLGVGGSAGHASHAVNDFRKICRFEAYTPTDNVSELTARINDEGWESCFAEWLKVSRVGERDALLVFSVGGGSAEKNVSVNLIRAIDEAKGRGAAVYGIVGKDGGYTKQAAEACVVIPPLSPERITPHTEGLCAVVWHLLVTHPALKAAETKWESVR